MPSGRKSTRPCSRACRRRPSSVCSRSSRARWPKRTTPWPSRPSAARSPWKAPSRATSRKKKSPALRPRSPRPPPRCSPCWRSSRPTGTGNTSSTTATGSCSARPRRPGHPVLRVGARISPPGTCPGSSPRSTSTFKRPWPPRSNSRRSRSNPSANCSTRAPCPTAIGPRSTTSWPTRPWSSTTRANRRQPRPKTPSSYRPTAPSSGRPRSSSPGLSTSGFPA